MIDNLSIALTHGLLLIAVWRLIRRPDLDHEDPPEPDMPTQGFHAQGFDTKRGSPDA